MDKNQSRSESARVHAITDAQEAASIESRHRLRSYGIKMALRAVLFVAGAIIAATWNIWVGVALLAASAVLPWFAVMDANLIANPESDDSATFLDAPPADQLTAGPAAAPSPADGAAQTPGESATDTGVAGSAEADAAGDVIEGSFLTDEAESDPQPERKPDQADGTDEPGGAAR